MYFHPIKLWSTLGIYPILCVPIPSWTSLADPLNHAHRRPCGRREGGGGDSGQDEGEQGQEEL